VILYYHGGGFSAGSPTAYRMFLGQLSKATQCRVLSVQYRLVPVHSLEDSREDCLAAYSWLMRAGWALPLEKPWEKVIVMGDSAGGGLVCLTLQSLKALQMPMPLCAVAMSPWTDLSCSGESHTTNVNRDSTIRLEGIFQALLPHLLGDSQEPRDPQHSALFGDWAGLPPILFTVGETERLLSDSVDAVQRARVAGVEAELEIHPHLPHVYPVYCITIPEAREALGRIAKFINDRLWGKDAAFNLYKSSGMPDTQSAL